MKRNLSSQAIKAMAIGMAVMMGSSTAISGVITGTVVNAYAAGSDTQEPTEITNGSTALAQDNYIIVNSGLLFKVDAGLSDSTGKAILVGKSTVSEETAADGSKAKPYGAKLEDGVLTLTTDKKYTLNVETISNGEADKKMTEVTGEVLSNAATLVTTINADALKGVTVTGNLNLPAVENLTNSLKGLTVTGDLSLPKLTAVSNTSFAGASGSDKGLVVTGTLTLKSDATIVENSFAFTEIGTLDLTKVGTITDGSNGAFKDAKITNLTHNGTALMNGATITNLTVPESVTEIAANSFKNATIPAKITLTKVTNIGANAFKVASPDTVEVTLPEYTNANLENIDATAFGVTADNKTFNIKLTNEAVTPEHATALQEKLVAQNNKVTVTASKPVADAPTLKTATIENANPSELVLKFSEAVKVANVDNQPQATEFTVMVGEQKNDVTAISKIEQTATSDTVKLTLKTPVTQGQKVTVAYTPGTNKILNGAGTELANFEATEVKNNVGGVVEEDFTATTTAGTYTFQKLDETSVALTKFEGAKSKKGAENTFVNGTFTQNGKPYTLTQIGTGTKVEGLTDAALKGHTDNVTVVKKDAFNGNTVITEISLPKVTKVEAGAFKGASKLTKMDLGSQTTTKVDIAADALTNTTSLKDISTNQASVSDIKNKVPNANVVVVENENKNDANATIRNGAYYQTKDGLRFVGINNNELKFIGTQKYQEPNGVTKFDGTEKNPYEVTYDKVDGTVTVTPGKEDVVVDTVEVTQNGHKLTFDVKNGNATLTNAIESKTKAATATGELKDGVVKANGKDYNFTTIGNGTALPTTFNATEVLKDNLNNVTTISAKAFEKNTATTELTLPVITNIGANAFNGATGLTKVDLGDKVVTVEEGAFNGANKVTVTSGNQTTIDNVINNGKLDAGKVETPESKKFVKTAIVKENPKEIKLTLNGNLKQALDAKDGFSIKVTGKGDTTQQIQNVTGGNSDSIITITLDKNIEAGQTVVVSYDGTNTKGDDLLVFDKEVDNQVSGEVVAEEVDAKVTGATVNGATLKITTTTALTPKTQLTSKEEFTVTKGTGNTPVTINKVEVKANEIVLTLAEEIAAGDTEIKFAYAGKNAELQSSDNKPIKAIESMLVVNAKDTTAPTASKGSSPATNNGSNKYTITLTTSEPVRIKDSNEITKEKFVVTRTGSGSSANVSSVDSVKIGDDKKSIVIDITTSEALQTNDKLQVEIQSGSNVVDYSSNGTTGNELEAKTISDIDIAGLGTYEMPIEKAVKGYVEYNTNQTTGDVTVISVATAPTNSTELQNIQDMLTSKLRRIEYLALNGYTTLNFDNVYISNLTIDRGAITRGTLNITGLTYAEQLELARRINGVGGVEIQGKTPQQIIDDNNYYRPDNNYGSSSNGSSSGSSGGGAVIGGVTDGNTESNNNNNNNNNNNSSSNNQFSQDKQLTFDVIKLPSINGEPKVFGDVSASHWAKSYIDKLSTAGIINGANGNFMPNGQTKRADVTVMLVNLLGLTPEANSKFADVNASAYYAPYVGAASSYGIVNGSNGMFNPEGIISRQDTMVMIAQILKGLNLNVNTDASSLGQFSDLSSVSNYAQESVAILVNSGIITGNNGKLNPKAPVTRAEMATIMSKLYDVLAAAK